MNIFGNMGCGGGNNCCNLIYIMLLLQCLGCGGCGCDEGNNCCDTILLLLLINCICGCQTPCNH